MSWPETTPHEACPLHAHGDSARGVSPVGGAGAGGTAPPVPAGLCGPEECQAAGCDGISPEPCPSPLGWSEVLARFRAESTPFELRRTGSLLRGHIWGEGPALYILPGLTESAELYALLLYVLRDQFRCVVFDRIEDRRHSRIRLDDLAADLPAVANELGDDRLFLAATGAGSLTALATMLADAGRIERAALLGGFARKRFSAFERAVLCLGRLLPGRLKHVPLRQIAALQNHRPWFPPFDGSRFEFFLNSTGENLLATVAARADVVRRTDLRPQLANIEAPVLLLRTEGEGTVAARDSDELAAGLRHARTVFLANCGQLPHLTHPHRTAKAIAAFLTLTEDSTHPSAAAAVPVR